MKKKTELLLTMQLSLLLFGISLRADAQITQYPNSANPSAEQERINRGSQDSTMNSFAKMGLDSLELLNDFEAKYLNDRFDDDRGMFDFTEKRVCFFGPGGLVFSNKREYFNNLKKNNHVIQNELYVFNETQKKESGGYDAAIVYWSKVRLSIDDVVKRLKKSKKRFR